MFFQKKVVGLVNQALLKKHQRRISSREFFEDFFAAKTFASCLVEAEKYNQFHDDMLDRYGDAYHAFRQYAQTTQCPGDQSSWPSFIS